MAPMLDHESGNPLYRTWYALAVHGRRARTPVMAAGGSGERIDGAESVCNAP